MKTARRVFSLLLVLAMVFALVACGGGSSEESTDTEGKGGSSVNTKTQGSNKGTNDDGDDTGDDTDAGDVSGGETSSSDTGIQTPTTITDVTQGGTEITITGPEVIIWEPEEPFNPSDFAGKDYVVIQHEAIEDPFKYSQDSYQGALVADRLGEVQNKFGCSISFAQVGYQNFATEVQGLMFAEDGGDMVFSSNNAQLRKTLGTGPDSIMTNLLDVDDIINFWDANKWGNITARETMMAGGTFFGVSPALWVDATPLPFYQLVYNKDLLSKFNLADPQEYWEQTAWDRDTMLDMITSSYDDSTGVAIWGMTADQGHMVRATALTTGVNLVEVEKIHGNGDVDWSLGLMSADVVEALQWLKNNQTAYAKYFNNGASTWKTWDAHTPFMSGQSVFCLTRPLDLFGSIVSAEGIGEFGLITWAGADPNVLTGYYENCYSIAIPTFAKDAKQTAYLMHDLFKGLGDIESYSDIVEYYRNTYFETDIDVICLFREGARLQYSYWPNGVDGIWAGITGSFATTSSIKTLLEKVEHTVDTEIETYMIPNLVQLEIFRQNGIID